jgi:hypothetical protein
MEDPRLSTLYPQRYPPKQPPQTPILPSYALEPIMPRYRPPETFWAPDRYYLRSPGTGRYVDENWVVIPIIPK